MSKVRPKSVGIVLAPRLGDSLQMMIVAQNLRRAGIAYRVYGDYALALADFFPGHPIFPALTMENMRSSLKEHDVNVQISHTWPFQLDAMGLPLWSAIPLPTPRINRVDQIANFCQNAFGLPTITRAIGLCVGKDKHAFREEQNRVLIHPTSSTSVREWLACRFIKLANCLRQEGFKPVIVVSAQERLVWMQRVPEDRLVPEFSRLSDLIPFVLRSGWCIGNDSGIGHLASSLGVPTLTICERGKQADVARPGWAPSRAIYPWYLPGVHLRNRYWRQAIPTSLVLAAFHKLRIQAATWTGRIE